MRPLALSALLALALIGLSGCAKPPETKARTWPTAPADPWRLVCTDPTQTTPAFLTNGWIGVRLNRLASGWEGETSLPAFAAHAYQTEGEEKIEALPNPLGVQWSLGDKPVSTGDLIAYEQVLDMKSGAMTTSFSVEGPSGEPIRFLCTTVLHPDLPIAAERWEVVAATEEPIEASIAHLAKAKGAPGGGDRYELPQGVVQVFTRTSGRFAGSMPGRMRKYYFTVRDLTFERVAVCDFEPAVRKIAQVRGSHTDAPTEELPTPSFDDVLAASTEAWAKRWETDIEIDGPVEDQQAVRSFMFYLTASMNPEAHREVPMGVSPLGLSGQTYNGHVFWDADIWVFPAMALLDPERAAIIPNYRLALAQAAKREADEWAAAASGGESPAGGVKFPWESSVTGRETVPGESRKQHHITGSVVWSLAQAAALGIVDQESVDRLRREASNFYRLRSEGPMNALEIKNTMSPDEFHIGDNDLYTNLLAEWVVRRSGRDVRYKLPHDSTTFLTYDNDTLKSYKQAAAVLAIYPLQHPQAEAEAAAMMERFAGKVTPNGPAMSDSVHALIWARIGEKERAYKTWRKSWGDFTQHPLMLFSEKRKKDVTYFLTGAGGCLQTVLYGFGGFRIDSRQDPDANWSKQLKGGQWLTLRPNLPPEWRRVVFKRFHVLGKTATFAVDAAGRCEVQEHP